MKLTEEQLKRLEMLLLKERDRVVRRLARLGMDDLADTAGSAFSVHIADQGTDAMEREKKFLLAGEEGRTLLAIHAALRRLYRTPERVGTCVDCGGEIGWERLEALPYTDTCVGCRTRQEVAG